MPKSAILGGKLFFYFDKMFFFSVLEGHMSGQIFLFILKELECSPCLLPQLSSACR